MSIYLFYRFTSEECGVRPYIKSGRIIGGKDASIGAWPWQVLVRELDENNKFTHNYYGGVLINPNYVITSAHWNPEYTFSDFKSRI